MPGAAKVMLVVMALHGCAERDHGACTLIGCGDIVAYLDVATVTDASVLDGARLDVCRNSDCVNGLVPVPSQDGHGSSLLRGSSQLRVTAWAVIVGPEIKVGAVIEDLSDTASIADGDVYAATLRRADGSTLTTAQWTATYRFSYPNGPDCGRCEFATLR